MDSAQGVSTQTGHILTNSMDEPVFLPSAASTTLLELGRCTVRQGWFLPCCRQGKQQAVLPELPGEAAYLWFHRSSRC